MGSIGPTEDENGLFTPFVKFLKIYSVTVFRFTSISHEKLDPIEAFEVGIPGLDWDPPFAKNSYFHTVCPFSLNQLYPLKG